MAKTKIKSDSETQVIDQVVDIIRLMGENKLAEIELETGDMKMSLKKHSAVQYQPVTAVPSPMPVAMHPVAAETAKTVVSKTEKQVESDKKDDFHKILSPMTGTFYRAPSPTSEPFVNEGDSVTVGQTVCIVEAMKMMNEIKADKAGKIAGICLENGKPVEKGTALFSIEG